MNDAPTHLSALVMATQPIEAGALERAKALLAELRDTQLAADELTERLTAKQKRVTEISTKELVDLFGEVGIQRLELSQDGNLPPVDAKLEHFVRANIAADWPEEKRNQAFEALGAAGGGDLIKRTFTLEFGRGPAEQASANKLRDALTKAGYTFTEKLAVPHMSLTAFVKEQALKLKRILPLEVLGATIGQVVKMKFKLEN